MNTLQDLGWTALLILAAVVTAGAFGIGPLAPDDATPPLPKPTLADAPPTVPMYRQSAATTPGPFQAASAFTDCHLCDAHRWHHKVIASGKVPPEQERCTLCKAWSSHKVAGVCSE